MKVKGVKVPILVERVFPVGVSVSCGIGESINAFLFVSLKQRKVMLQNRIKS